MPSSGSEIGGYLFVVGPAAGMLLINRRELRRWLLARPLPWRGPRTLAPEPVMRTLIRQVRARLRPRRRRP